MHSYAHTEIGIKVNNCYDSRSQRIEFLTMDEM